MKDFELEKKEINRINEEIKNFIYEPDYVDDVRFLVTEGRYPTGKKIEVEVTIRGAK